MTYLIKLLGLRSGGPTPFDNQWLAEYDPDRPGEDPNGEPMLAHVVTTSDPAAAIHFDSFAAAHQQWRRVSTKWPVRPDGKPNRPLSAFSVVCEAAPAQGASSS